MTPYYMVTGMFRSGTTMLARMLHANPHVVCASDPYAPIFKSYRNSHMKKLGAEMNMDAPLHDYYFDKGQYELFKDMRESDFNTKFDVETISQLREKIKSHCEPYSPMIHDYIELLNGNSYAELFRSGMHVIEKSYNKKDIKAIGYKDVWVGEFSRHFLNLGDDTKVIHLVRDPRSVIASNFASGSRYPLIFLARQWRKLASLAWLDNSNSNRVKLIRFEDLLSSPKAVAKDICEFLEVTYSDDMIDPQRYKDGSGKPWRQNTSYISKESDNKQNGQAFNLTAIDKWKKTLSNEVLELIGKLCFYEMKLLGYEGIPEFSSNSDPLSNIEYEDELSSLAEWIKPYSNYNNFKELATESARYRLINSGQQVSNAVKQLVALDINIYDKLTTLSKG